MLGYWSGEREGEGQGGVLEKGRRERGKEKGREKDETRKEKGKKEEKGKKKRKERRREGKEEEKGKKKRRGTTYQIGRHKPCRKQVRTHPDVTGRCTTATGS